MELEVVPLAVWLAAGLVLRHEGEVRERERERGARSKRTRKTIARANFCRRVKIFHFFFPSSLSLHFTKLDGVRAGAAAVATGRGCCSSVESCYEDRGPRRRGAHLPSQRRRQSGNADRQHRRRRRRKGLVVVVVSFLLLLLRPPAGPCDAAPAAVLRPQGR